MSWVATASSKNGRVQGPTVPVRQHPGLCDYLAHRVEDTLRLLAGTQPRPPEGQHRRVKPRVGQRQTRCCFPRYITTQPLDSFPIRDTLQRLEDQHRRHHRPPNRRTTPPTTEQIPKHLIGKQPAAVLSQKPVHRTHRNQFPTHFHSIQKLTIKTFNTLHTPTIIPQHLNREPITPDKVI